MKSSKFMRRIRIGLHQRFGVVSLRQSMPDLADWFKTPLGQALLEQEQQILEQRLQDLFGYHLVQMSVDPELDLTQGSRIGHRISVSPRGDWRPSLSPLISEHHNLPLPSESVDLVVLHHLLDYSQTPHQLLREVSRVLIPRGHLVIVGFNPWSGFGFNRWLARGLSTRPLWRHQSLRLGRLLDWMQLVDLQTETIDRGFFRPAVHHPELLKRLQWLEAWGKKLRWPGGAVYVIVACKEVGGAIPVKPSWDDRPRKVPGLGVNPMRKTPRASHRISGENRAVIDKNQ